MKIEMEYTSSPHLMVQLTRYRDDRGDFMEIARPVNQHYPEGCQAELEVGDTPYDFDLRQINYAFIRRRAVKAWHRHRFQDDIFVVLDGVAVVHAISPNLLTCERFVLHGQSPSPLFIPKGWYHGISAIEDVHMIYLVNNVYDGTDEERYECGFWWTEIEKQYPPLKVYRASDTMECIKCKANLTIDRGLEDGTDERKCRTCGTTWPLAKNEWERIGGHRATVPEDVREKLNVIDDKVWWRIKDS